VFGEQNWACNIRLGEVFKDLSPAHIQDDFFLEIHICSIPLELESFPSEVEIVEKILGKFRKMKRKLSCF
jgi:hypothetical protein